MPNRSHTELSWDEALEGATRALQASGADRAQALAAARSLCAAEAEGSPNVGFRHLLSYCEALKAGRITGDPDPAVEQPSASLIRVDAQGGLPHLAVERAWDDFTAAAKSTGIALLALRNGYTCGALGYFVRRLAQEQGLVGLMAANAAPAVMPASGGSKPAFCTNPLAFAVPCGDGEAIVIDQSSSAGALVGIHQAAVEGRAIPEGWALNAQGQPTTDPKEALEGVLLPFGGARGANIALMVELLAAGLTGANWSCEAPPFNAGDRTPGVGLLIIAINPDQSAGSDFAERIRSYADILQSDGAYLPGLGKSNAQAVARKEGLQVESTLWKKILELGGA